MSRVEEVAEKNTGKLYTNIKEREWWEGVIAATPLGI